MRSALAACRRFSSSASIKFSTEVTWSLSQDLKSLRTFSPYVSEIFIPFQSQKSCDDIIKVTKELMENDFVPVPHIPVRRFRSLREFERFVANLQSWGIRKVLIIGGDDKVAKGPLYETLQVLNSGLLQGFEVVGVAAHANGNPVDERSEQSFNEKVAWSKQSGIPLFAVTNLCLNPEALENFVRKIPSQIDVYVGVPGPCSMKTLSIFAELCLSGQVPSQLARTSPGMFSSMFAPEDFVSRFSKLTPRIHMYSFGGLKKTLEWIARYSEQSRT